MLVPDYSILESQIFFVMLYRSTILSMLLQHYHLLAAVQGLLGHGIGKGNGLGKTSNPQRICIRNWIQRILIKIPSPLQPNRILSDIPPLQRVIIAVAVVIQAGLLIILLPRQADKLLQLMRVLFIQQVAPFIVFCAPFCCPFLADKGQRQAAMVAVVQVDFFAPACTPGPSGFCICSTVRPHDASQRRLSSLTRSAGDFTFQPVEHLHRAGGNPPLCIGNSRYERFSLSIAEVIISLSSNLYNIVSKTGSSVLSPNSPAASMISS